MMNRYANVYIRCISEVRPHPWNNNLDIVTVAGRINVASRSKPDLPRYKAGDFAVVLDQNLVVSEDLQKYLDHGHVEQDRIKIGLIQGVVSEVALCAVDWVREPDRVSDQAGYVVQIGWLEVAGHGMSSMRLVRCDDPDRIELSPEGYDVGSLLGVASI